MHAIVLRHTEPIEVQATTVSEVYCGTRNLQCRGSVTKTGLANTKEGAACGMCSEAKDHDIVEEGLEASSRILSALANIPDLNRVVREELVAHPSPAAHAAALRRLVRIAGATRKTARTLPRCLPLVDLIACERLDVMLDNCTALGSNMMLQHC